MINSLISGVSGLLGSVLGQQAADKATDKQIAWFGALQTTTKENIC